MPVWREVLADLETPLSAFVKLVGDREGFLLESVEHAERWGRFSFLGRDPALHVRRARPRASSGSAATPPDGVPSDQGTLAALEALLAALPRADAAGAPAVPRRHRRLDRLRHGARDRAPARTCPPTTSASPTRCCSLAGQVAAFDHFRQRLLPDRERVPAARRRRRRRSTRCTTARSRGSTTRSTSSAGRCRTCPRCRPPTSSTELPEVRRNFSGAAWAAAVEAAKEHILDGDIFQVVLAQRFDLVEPVDPFAVYRVLRLVNPSPYMYFLRHPEATIVGSSPEPMVQVRDGRVISRPIAGTRRRGRDERARPAARGRARRAPEGTRRARDARRPRAQRRRAGSCASAPSASRS